MVNFVEWIGTDANPIHRRGIEDFKMSSISSLSGSISQFIQNLNPSGAASATSNASSGSTTAAVPHHHHHGGGFSKLADAIESALQSASNGSSGSTTTDPNQTITQALTKIFQNGSLNTTPDGDGDTTASAGSTPSSTSTNGVPTGNLPGDFVQTLQSFGVTPQQFQADLATALQTAQQTGQADLSGIFKNFPPGSIVDTTG